MPPTASGGGGWRRKVWLRHSRPSRVKEVERKKKGRRKKRKEEER
jgi:hypothetical protein